MFSVITDLKRLEIETLKNLSNSKSKNTLRAYKADFERFCSFLRLVMDLTTLPTEPEISSPIFNCIYHKTSKFSTLKRRLASISVIQKLRGHYLDIKHPSNH